MTQEKHLSSLQIYNFYSTADHKNPRNHNGGGRLFPPSLGLGIWLSGLDPQCWVYSSRTCFCLGGWVSLDIYGEKGDVLDAGKEM